MRPIENFTETGIQITTHHQGKAPYRDKNLV